MNNWGTQAREQASRAKAGANFPFLSLPEGGSVQMLMPGSIASVADKQRPDKMQNHMHVVLLSGTESMRQDDKTSLPVEVTSPIVRKLSLNATMTKQYKLIMAQWKSEGLPVVEITDNPNRGDWESGRNLKQVGEFTGPQIDEAVKAAGWEDIDLPF